MGETWRKEREITDFEREKKEREKGDKLGGERNIIFRKRE